MHLPIYTLPSQGERPLFFLEEGSCLPFYVCAAFFSFFTVLNGNHMRKTPWIVKNTA